MNRDELKDLIYAKAAEHIEGGIDDCDASYIAEAVLEALQASNSKEQSIDAEWASIRPDVAWSSIEATEASRIVILRAQRYAHAMNNAGDPSVTSLDRVTRMSSTLIELLDAVAALDEINARVRRELGED